MQFEHPNSQPKMNDQTPLTNAVEASLVPFVLATPHHAPADLSHSVQNSRKLTEAQLEAIVGGQPLFLLVAPKEEGNSM